MFKAKSVRIISLILAVLSTALLLSACKKEAEPRVSTTYTFDPGTMFLTNINDEDPRRVVKCSVIFEVIDPAARMELSEQNHAIRDAVLVVLGELTLEELTKGRDLQDISQRMVNKVNEQINSVEDLVIGAYFTEFVLG